MTTTIPHRHVAGRPRTLALHCSGSSGRQWRRLQEHATGAIRVIAPDLYGSAGAGQWTGQHAFSLADEAERVLSLLEPEAGRLHVVGHSYGGAVALKIAAMMPQRIASLSLYEPSAFHLLPTLGPRGRAAFCDIRRIARAVRDGLVSGDYQAGARHFVDYWNGPGTWAAMKPDAKVELMGYVPKACLDFQALFDEDTPSTVYRAFRFPVLVLAGQFAPAPTRVVAEGLAGRVPGALHAVIPGAGHMGPFTHAEAVNSHILAHIRNAALHDGRPAREAA